ncbi:NACHT domain-containing protein [Actinosynnema sp. CS-041913]|uniref:NACHT domain-containing protein n=1 Tax=Actinosynnema sp. CS-041913 TaxID=3239917 RepID=UPI003D8E806C
MAQETPADVIEQLRQALPFSVPSWAVTTLLLLALLGALGSLASSWLPLVRLGARLFFRLIDRGDRRRARRRALFADHVESGLRRLAEREEWRDSRYAELEAELEVFTPARFLPFRRVARGLRRVPSLSEALRRSDERVLLLEGDPGAGKSVALRHLAQRMAAEAMRGPTERGTIPVYVDLKTFAPTHPPTSEDVREFVFASLNRARDRDVEQFLSEEFPRGLEQGTWLFLFDSFDEIPAVLGAADADEAIVAYADAIHAFLHASTRCRGVVASREFRGPGRAAWPMLRIVPLTERRKHDLIQRVDLPLSVERMLVYGLADADEAVRQLSDSPLFLSLLCEYARETGALPPNAHVVLESYVDHRLRRDVRPDGDVGPSVVREVAEELAFTMAVSGLSVVRSEAVDVIAARLGRPAADVRRAVDALVYTKLARAEDGRLTFAHRRMQEYFATCAVLRRPDRVDSRTLLTDGRWREVAVTLFQTQEPTRHAGLLAEAAALLPERSRQRWPPGVLYLLRLLADGLGRPGHGIAERVGDLLRVAWLDGVRYDRKWALEVVAAADRDTAAWLLKFGFASESEWLRQEAYRQVRRVPDVAGELAGQVRQTLLDLSVGGRLRRDFRSTLSRLGRLPNAGDFVPHLWRLRLAPYVHLLGVGGVGMVYRGGDGGWVLFAGTAGFFCFRAACASSSVRRTRPAVVRWMSRVVGDEVAAVVLGAAAGVGYLALAVALVGSLWVAPSVAGLVVGAVAVGCLAFASWSVRGSVTPRPGRKLLRGASVMPGPGRKLLLEVVPRPGWKLLLVAAVVGGAVAVDRFVPWSGAVVGGLLLVVPLVLSAAGFARGFREGVRVRRFLRDRDVEAVTSSEIGGLLLGLDTEGAVLRLLAVVSRRDAPLDAGWEELLSRVAASWTWSSAVLDEVHVLLDRALRRAALEFSLP